MAHKSKFPKLGVSAVAGAILLAISGTALADAFSKEGGGSQVTAELTQRMRMLEERLSQLQLAQERAANDEIIRRKAEEEAEKAKGADKSKVSRVADMDILATPPYEILGRVNNRHLVKAGDRRYSFTDEQLESFETLEYEKAQERKKRGVSAPAVNTGAPNNMLPPPPPPAGSVNPKNSKTAQKVNQTNANAQNAVSAANAAPAPAAAKQTAAQRRAAKAAANQNATK